MQQRVIIKDSFLGSSFQRKKKKKSPHKTCSSLREGFKSSSYVRRPGDLWVYFQGPQGIPSGAAGMGGGSLRAPPRPHRNPDSHTARTLPSAGPLPPSGSTARGCEGPGPPCLRGAGALSLWNECSRASGEREKSGRTGGKGEEKARMCWR